VAASDTKALIAQAIDRLQEEVPALAQLKLVVRLELRARGTDVPIWRVEVPGPKIDRDPAADARIDVSLARSHFNELAQDGKARHYRDAYQQGHIKVSGDPGIQKLIAQVIERHEERGRTRKVH
jgi:hypothetical protein